MKNFIKLSVAAFLMAAAMLSCTRLEVTLPEGPRGEQGIQGVSGVPGKTAYEIWKEYIASGEVEDPAAPGSKWDPGRNTVYDFFTFLVGPKGDDGLSSYEVWIEAVERHTIDYTGSVTIVDYFKYLEGKDGKDGRDGRDGKDGLVPYIGDNGNWFIGDEDTGVPARGDKGEKGDGGLSAYEIWKMSVLSDEGLPNPGNGVYDVGEYPYWPADAVSEADFYLYLHGVKGDDGKSAYEVWKEYISSGDVENPQIPGTLWDPDDNTLQDYYEFLTGPKGDDGLIPYIGENGNWFIGDEDTGVPARGEDGADGQDGADGSTPYIGENGNWFIGDEDTGVPARGEDGADGQDGNDGADGKSAYEIWKEDVLSTSGLANPGNGVYDLAEYPKWPTSAVSLADFWLYLRGRDGVDGQNGSNGTVYSLTDTAYVERVDPGMYNVAPVIALGKTKDGGVEYEYVNPVSGGAAFIVTGPGPVIIPDCEVVFKDLSGTKTYTKTSDSQGYVYLTREELPEWSEGLPSAKDTPGDISSGVRPVSFKYGSVTVTDESKIASTCKVPYRVGLSVVTDSGAIYDYSAHAAFRVYRIVEGVVETEAFINFKNMVSHWNYPSMSRGFWPTVNTSFKYYRKGVEILLSRVSAEYTLGPEFSSLEDDELTDWFSDLNHICGQKAYDYALQRAMVSRTRVKDGSVSWFRARFGDGAEPSSVGVYDLMLKYDGGVAGSGAGELLPDYGLSVTDTAREVMNPPYSSIPQGVQGKYVWDSGHTSLTLGLSDVKALKDKTIYKGGDWDSDNARYVFETETFGKAYKNGATTKFTVSGKYSGTTINSTVNFPLYEALDLKDVYDGFSLTVADFVDGSVMLGGFSGKFSTNLPGVQSIDDATASAFGNSLTVEVKNVTNIGE